jgi:WD40 repeat protein
VYGDNRLVDGQTGQELGAFTFESRKDILNISMSPDGSFLATVCESDDERISIWTTSPEYLTTTLGGHIGQIQITRFSVDGNFLISGSVDRTIRLWQCSTWTCIAVLYGHWGRVTDLAWLPDGKHIISVSDWDRTIRIWNISAVLEGKEFDVKVRNGALVAGGWFRQAISLGGWFGGYPFVFEYPFEWPPAVKPLRWNIASGLGDVDT